MRKPGGPESQLECVTGWSGEQARPGCGADTVPFWVRGLEQVIRGLSGKWLALWRRDSGDGGLLCGRRAVREVD